MKRVLGVIAIAVLVGAAPFTSAIARTKLVDYAEQEGMDIPAPGPAESVIVFLRASRYGGATAATVYERNDDGSVTMITAAYPFTYFVHTVTPGKHVFAVVSEAADFIEVNAAPGRIYPVMVTPRIGAWKARFSLRSGSPGSEFWGEIHEWLAKSSRVTPNEAAPVWFEEHRTSVLSKVGEYWPIWIARLDRPIVTGDEGITGF